MNRLLDIGFQLVGHWCIGEDSLTFELRRHGTQMNILYAFVSDGEVMYVGKTVRTLNQRLTGYRNPVPSQSTNIRNNARIRDVLRSGAAVDILALPDNGLLHYGPFHLNLAAGLEDSIIAVLRPAWNTVQKKSTEAGLDSITSERTVEQFSVTLQKTYWERGFFNVPVAEARSFGADGQMIDIFCGATNRPITGAINRSCNKTYAPRILGGTGLRDWFQANFKTLDEITIHVLSPNTIRIDGDSGG